MENLAALKIENEPNIEVTQTPENEDPCLWQE